MTLKDINPTVVAEISLEDYVEVLTMESELNALEHEVTEIINVVEDARVKLERLDELASENHDSYEFYRDVVITELGFEDDGKSEGTLAKIKAWFKNVYKLIMDKLGQFGNTVTSYFKKTKKVTETTNKEAVKVMKEAAVIVKEAKVESNTVSNLDSIIDTVFEKFEYHGTTREELKRVSVVLEAKDKTLAKTHYLTESEGRFVYVPKWNVDVINMQLEAEVRFWNVLVLRNRKATEGLNAYDLATDTHQYLKLVERTVKSFLEDTTVEKTTTPLIVKISEHQGIYKVTRSDGDSSFVSNIKAPEYMFNRASYMDKVSRVIDSCCRLNDSTNEMMNKLDKIAETEKVNTSVTMDLTRALQHCYVFAGDLMKIQADLTWDFLSVIEKG